MTSTQSSTGGQTENELGHAALLREIEHLRLAAERPSESLLAALQDAGEELRVADEELRAQQETIARLVDSHRDLRLQQERTMSVLPVPVVVTDPRGVIRSVNAAAAHLMDMRVAHLLGKPLLALFAADDRPELRRLIASGARGSQGLVVRRTATLVPRAHPSVLVELTGSLQLPGAADGEISWIILASAMRQRSTPVPETLVALASLANGSNGDSDVTRVLTEAASICAGVLGLHVSISLGSPLDPTATASSSRVAQLCDGAQVTAGEGPSVDAHAAGRPVASRSPGADDRWPRLGRGLPEPFASAVATPIVSTDHVVGTLTAYGPTGSAAPEEAEEVLGLLGFTIGSVLTELELHQQLARVRGDMERALESRSVIDQAKGIVMATRGVDATAAWAHLAQLSSTQHQKVRDIAEQIVRRTSADG